MNKDSEIVYVKVKCLEREKRKEQGFFDGRFAPKTIPNKKKESEKRTSRITKVNLKYLE